MQTAIKAIETRWRGRLYRSRLEARWAVFFETMGIKFLYEPEGYEMPDGTRYLPDFYLPDYKWFAEVKPFAGTSSKAHLFVRHGGGDVLMLDGEPDFRSYTGLQHIVVGERDMDGECQSWGSEDHVCPQEFSLDVWGYDTVGERFWSDPDYEGMVKNLSGEIEAAFSIRYRAGIEAALSARFGT